MKKHIINILIILTCALSAASAASATSTLNLGVQVAEVPATFTIHYDKNYREGAIAPENEAVAITEYGHRPYSIYYSGNRENAGKVSVNISATSFLNLEDASLPSAPVRLYHVDKGFATSTASLPASMDLNPIALPAGNVSTSVLLDGSDFMVIWQPAPSLPAGNYQSTITVSYTVV